MGNLTLKLIAVVLIAICIAVGAVGLILPVIPGLLFLAIALMLIASFFPSIDRRLRRNGTMRRYLDSVDGFGNLSFGQQIRFGLLLGLRLLIDTVALLVYAVSKLLGFAAVTYRSYR